MKKAILPALALIACATAADEFTAAREGNMAKPATVAVDFSVSCGPVKPMNAVNNGPVGNGAGVRQHGNFTEYRAARIPFARTHDAAEYIVYGGDHVADVTAMFPNFDADENDPKNYDFTVTDAYLGDMRAAGTEPFFRLGQRIEHAAKRYNVWPPKDFAKWARICEHVIRHYNRGWANGFTWSIKYWEIWNEPDIDENWQKKGNPNMWGGTPEEFFEFFEIAAKHLKGKFPELKIGGPALAGRMAYGDRFLKYQHEHGTPIDFFSWHIYARDPAAMAERARTVREMMEKHGYGNAESILNEWNYVKGWGNSYHSSITRLAGQKGGAFVAAGMIACQHAPVDMLMYYDAKPDAHFNGMFDKTSLRPLPAYYAIYAWGQLAKCATAVKASADIPDIYAAAARDNDGHRMLFLARYADDDNFSSARPVTVRLASGAFPPEVSVYVTDADRRHTEMNLPASSANELRLMMDPQSFMLVEYDEPPTPSENSFVVSSFNIRIDTDEKGKPVDSGDNAWPARRPRVAEVVRSGGFQLIGFQEVTKTMWPDLVADFPEFRFADGPDKQGPNPIAYRPELFERLDSGRFALSEKPEDFETLTWGSSSVRVCQWALLRHKGTGRLVRMFNQHPDWKSMEQRVKGMEHVVGKIKAAKERGELVILTGDMNDMEGAVSIHAWAPFDERYPVGASIRLAKSVLSDTLDICMTPHAGPVLSSHGYSQKPGSRLDYIFVSDGFRVLSHRTHDDRPGGKYPSDHDAVSARIDFQ